MSITHGIESIKKATGVRIHSIPDTHRSSYLDLFMLEKEKKKLVKECSTLEKKLKENVERIKEIKEQARKLKKEGFQKKGTFSLKNQRISESERVEKSEWKTLKIGY